ncbi:hypothetical protein PDPE_1-02790 [Photobacterium damselae subsp. piscicida]|uniref:Lipoprotein n=1 Tax=Photobacterium damsela subsp. piscicida TaxID=38294 RepID=A0AAD1CG89_PHODP|nr:hypothetical protein PDPUS_1_01696 [Photobacterium damselae subsp. piscicida]BBC41949.1 hypothetical protein PDPE_1-02790 [Photobacterium damselae subsp. piscicida]GAW45544.1 hypothetical protein PDPJ_1_02959 [Photobacterium damselae subsp. piscicida]
MMKKWLFLMVAASSAAMLSGCDTQSTSPATKGIDDQGHGNVNMQHLITRLICR